MNKRAFQTGLFFGLLFFAFSVNAQDQLGIRDRADKLYTEYQYAKAAAIYLKLTDVKNPKLKDMERLADCYSKMNKYEDAEIWYARAVAEPGSSPENLISYGEILKANSLYAKAKTVLQEYATKTGNKDRVAVALAGCDSAQIWLSSPTRHKLRNELAVNTQYSEFSATPVGNRVFYAGEPEVADFSKKYGWTGNSFLRIFTATKSDDNTLNTPLIAGSELNSETYHIGPLTTTQSGDMFLITRTYPGKDAGIKKDSRGIYRTNKMELYFQSFVYGKWQKPIPFAYNNVKEYSVGHAALSPDGRILYFVSDMPGGQGGTDIWFTELQADGNWGSCFNAGNQVNTAGDELFPTVSKDGTLYFSSNGWPGMGGLDIFRSRGKKDNWSKPANMKYPVNSAGDDFSYIINEAQSAGYLSSNRKNGKGSDDIYSFSYQKPKNSHYIKGVVYDKKTGLRLQAAVTMFASNSVVARQETAADGAFVFQADEQTPYNIQGVKFSYYSDSVNVVIRPSEVDDTAKVALYLEPLFEKGKTIRIENIHYNFDKDDIRADAAVILDKLVKTMHENPSLKIELASHTDSRGTDVYNHDLSQRRAQSAVNYLVTRGISRDRMIAKGYGESKLLNKCKDGVECTDDEHQANRRTEFTVLSY